METVEGGDLDGRVNRRSPEIPLLLQLLPRARVCIQGCYRANSWLCLEGRDESNPAANDSFIRPLLTRGSFGVGEGAVLLPPHSGSAFFSVLDSS